MKTYLQIWYNTNMDSAGPTEVNNRLMSLGFQPIQGPNDYVYEWTDNASTNDIIRFGDKIHLTLSGTNVLFKIETI